MKNFLEYFDYTNSCFICNEKLNYNFKFIIKNDKFLYKCSSIKQDLYFNIKDNHISCSDIFDFKNKLKSISPKIRFVASHYCYSSNYNYKNNSCNYSYSFSIKLLIDPIFMSFKIIPIEEKIAIPNIIIYNDLINNKSSIINYLNNSRSESFSDKILSHNQILNKINIYQLLK